MNLRDATARALVLCWVVAALASEARGVTADERVDFERQIRPILAASCVSCHGPDKQKGGLRLDQKESALEGGDQAAILPGRGNDSAIVQLTSGQDLDRIMPPKGERLTPQQIQLIRTWIDQGAEWPDQPATANRRDWWSLRRLVRPEVPALAPEDAARARSPVDAFVFARLRKEGLQPSPEADRRTLIRRLSFDLVGLPPTPQEINAFVADPAPDAYESLVDRLLASPAYGERWARHWLDVVHYGDSHGYDKDKPRPNAWPYRDYVIRAFNDDKPYARFVREQVAGDVLRPATAEGVVATGFLAAGPWDFIGHAEVPETKIDGKIARHLDRDDMAANTLNTFASLTVQCAQCHDHKFDPVRQEEYYRLQAVFAAVDRADRPFYADPSAATRAADLTLARDTLRQRRAVREAEIRTAGGDALAELDRQIEAMARPAAPRVEFGYHSGLEPVADRPKWVQVDLGRSVAVDRVILWGAHDDFNQIGAGFGFPLRFRIELAEDAGFQTGVSVVEDHGKTDVPNPGTAARSFPAGGKQGRYVRLTAEKLATRQGDFHLAMAELEVLDASGTNIAARAAVTAMDSIEAPPRWGVTNLTDGHAPGKDNQPTNLEPLRDRRRSMVAQALGPDRLKDWEEILKALASTEADLAQIVPSGMVYTATIYDGGRTSPFQGTGADGGKPRPIYLLRRGDVKSPVREVAPGVPAVSADFPGDFVLTEGHPEGQRRAALAEWLADSRNPLTWRSIVNRVWQYHFGRALAETPGDFGRMGRPPSHPELLDWLAVEFRDGGQSFKALHRLIVTSATYRQTSAGGGPSEAIDSGNVLLWRMNRRKLEAEAIRDAALAVAGTLDRSMYGPPFRDFVVEHPEHSPHYEYRLHDPDDPLARRRSIYRFLARSRPEPLMAALDCADPSMRVDRRDETLSPLQALALYNNGLMLTTARHMAKRFQAEGVAAAFREAIGREPSATEREALEAHARERGLANACRVILNLNEFVFVD